MGRFLSVDPVTFLDTGNPGQFNRYAYTWNDPINAYDPDGALPVLVVPVLMFVAKEIAAEAASRATGGATDFLSVRRTGTKLLKSGVGVSHRAITQSLKNPRSKEAVKGSKTYQTYIKKSKSDDVGNYSGRTSGTGTPFENVAKRDRNHHKNDTHGPAVLDKSSSNPDAIRGREDQNIIANGGAQSANGTSGNNIRGIAENNPKREQYHKACNDEFC